MKTEFNLSEKKHELSTIDKLTLGIPVENNEHIYYKEEDVKEFIRLLKKEIKKGVVLDCWQNMTIAQIKGQIDFIINDLLGDKLR
jgi:RNase H-fold protein (predicted Holliday junction resolvase)